ncbi:dicarboxylate/amino acid:cation symporter [Spiroplasma chrysopicola]|uniref:L-cystine uptake protein TcyP n=1 Tax=Spiroplasma chrysopicola DF-1 TaxID=1276227 RepID=R4UB36_9MOLU|nr:dicarboxylate/amino acid:cation symporter [Spiroplasma chrysopicola]AGM25114.1 proton/glutamate symporter [Spiroplasma chrysopicola DF-1]
MTINLLADNAGSSILNDFLALGSWQTLVAVVVFYAVIIPFFILINRYKVKFIYRILMGLGIGLVFGIVIQAIIGFPQTAEGLKEHTWVMQFNIWANLLKEIFINGILLLTVPVVFLAIFRITAKPGQKGIGRITLKGIGLLLLNVTFAFIITFWLGILFKVGAGMDLDSQVEGNDPNGTHETKPLPQIIWDYMPKNFMGALALGVIIPVMVLGAITGHSVKMLNKRKPEQMARIRNAMDTGWDLVISMLMTFMKIMPIAVISMITTAITSRPIGALATIGKVIGLGYLSLLISVAFLTLMLFLFGFRLKGWWKAAWKPLVQAFATQSSNATLPVAMETLKDDMKVDDKVVSTIAPLSTSLGLMACAGVQAGLVTSFLWTGSDKIASGFSGGLAVFFIMSLIICLIASLGIAGIPGTAAVVTSGVLGGLGYASMFGPVYAIIGALDGLFDMGRTAVNVVAGVAVASMTAKTEGLIGDDSEILSAKQLAKQKEILSNRIKKDNLKETKQLALKEKMAAKKAS